MNKKDVTAKVMQKLAEEEIDKLLKKHDWQFEMSDDQSKWSKGSKEEKVILKILSGMDVKEAFDLWHKYAPSNGKIEKNKFEHMMKVYKDKK